MGAVDQNAQKSNNATVNTSSLRWTMKAGLGLVDMKMANIHIIWQNIGAIFGQDMSKISKRSMQIILSKELMADAVNEQHKLRRRKGPVNIYIFCSSIFFNYKHQKKRRNQCFVLCPQMRVFVHFCRYSSMGIFLKKMIFFILAEKQSYRKIDMLILPAKTQILTVWSESV